MSRSDAVSTSGTKSKAFFPAKMEDGGGTAGTLSINRGDERGGIPSNEIEKILKSLLS